jgi:hypothetical protein
VVAVRTGIEATVRKRALWVLVAFSLACLYPAAVAAQGGGLIRGTVLNGTTDGRSTDGLEVVLRTFQENSESQQRVALADAQGQFAFEGLETGSSWAYLLQVDYGGVTYSRGMLSFEADTSELEAQVNVYESTDDEAVTTASRAHIFVDVSDTGLAVTELYVFSNPTDRTYVGVERVGDRLWTSEFLLPQGAYDLSFDDGSLGGRFLSVQGGFVDTEAHWPGTTSVLFYYRVDCPGGVCDLGREITFPISNLNAMVTDTGARVTSERLPLEGMREAQGQSYLNYLGRDLSPGEPLDLTVHLTDDLPVSTDSRPRSAQALPWILLGGVLTFLVLAYPFWRRRIEASVRDKR